MALVMAGGGGETVMPVSVPVMVPFEASVTVSDWVPTVLKVAVKLWTPLSAA